jgi:hypothetical protein
MEPLILKATDSTPGVVFDKEKGVFEITGNSLPEDVTKFYQPVFDWLRMYIDEPNPLTLLVFKLTYFNSASSKTIFSLLSLLENLFSKGAQIKVDWCYMEIDEDTLDAGKEYAGMVKIPFTFKQFQSF